MLQRNSSIHLLIIFGTLFGTALTKNYLQCYKCEGKVECSRSLERLEIQNCTQSDNPDEDERFCISYVDPMTTDEIISRGCTSTVLELNGFILISCNGMKLKHGNQTILKRFCICQSDRCNVKVPNINCADDGLPLWRILIDLIVGFVKYIFVPAFILCLISDVFS